MKLTWSNLAKDELRELHRFSVERWGRDAALRYLDDVRTAAKQLALDPLGAKPLRAPYRVLRVRSHCLIVHVDDAAGRLAVARVLHVPMDIERHFPPWDGVQ